MCWKLCSVTKHNLLLINLLSGQAAACLRRAFYQMERSKSSHKAHLNVISINVSALTIVVAGVYTRRPCDHDTQRDPAKQSGFLLINTTCNYHISHSTYRPFLLGTTNGRQNCIIKNESWHDRWKVWVVVKVRLRSRVRDIHKMLTCLKKWKVEKQTCSRSCLRSSGAPMSSSATLGFPECCSNGRHNVILTGWTAATTSCWDLH